MQSCTETRSQDLWYGTIDLGIKFTGNHKCAADCRSSNGTDPANYFNTIAIIILQLCPGMRGRHSHQWNVRGTWVTFSPCRGPTAYWWIVSVILYISPPNLLEYVFRPCRHSISYFHMLCRGPTQTKQNNNRRYCNYTPYYLSNVAACWQHP